MTRRQKKNLFRIVLAAALLIVVSPLPLPGIWKLFAYLVPYAVIGYDVLWNALRKILGGQLFDEEFLMSIATIGAFALQEYPEAVFVMLFYQVGEWFQGIAVGKSRRSIASLMDIRPDTANVIRGGELSVVSPEEVQAGEIIAIQPGERVPLDGVIVKGETSVDTKALTGESLPRDLSIGDRIVSGSINLTGAIQVKTESVFEQSTVNRILELVENASAKKARIESFITRFSRVYTPIVVLLAALIAFVPPLLLSLSWGEWVERALIFLVVSCPCALVVSVPLSFFGGIGGASKSGILIKSSNDLEMLSKVKCVVFDKTGTLTRGDFTVTGVYPRGVDADALLSIAAAAESRSMHPIAKGIQRACSIKPDEEIIGSVTEQGGHGVIAEIGAARVLAGNEKLLASEGVVFEKPTDAKGALVYIARNGEYLGCIELNDEIKPGAREALRTMKALGIGKTAMLTGDRREAAEKIRAEAGADEVRYELLPQDKVREIERMLESDSPLAFVGDGINDAPALSRADLGIAMGAMGSDAAIEAADVVLMDDNLSKIPRAIAVARKTMAIVRENIALALGVKIGVMLLGAIGLAGMWLAVFADVGVLVLAILNAMRCMREPKI